jgi:hypothetical protein
MHELIKYKIPESNHVFDDKYNSSYIRRLMNTTRKVTPLAHHSNSLPLALESITLRHLHV